MRASDEKQSHTLELLQSSFSLVEVLHNLDDEDGKTNETNEDEDKNNTGWKHFGLDI